MKKVILVFVFVTLLLTGPSLISVNAVERSTNEDFFQSYLNFANDLYQEQGVLSNQLYSPISLFYVLMILNSLSSNELSLDFETYFGFTKEEMLLEMPYLTEDIIAGLDESEFWFHNFLFYDNATPLFDTILLDSIQPTFNYSLEELSFYDGEASRVLASRITEGTNHFLELTEDDFLELLSANFVINNTIYYKGIWQTLFAESDNFEELFYLEDDSSQTVTYMTKIDKNVYYHQEETFSVASIFMTDGVKIQFIKPEGDHTLNDLFADETLMPALFNQNFETYPMSVEIQIPKFAYESEVDFRQALINLGLEGIYEFRTDNFSDLVDGEVFGISMIKQISKIELDEEGVTAASSTTSIGCTKSAEPLVFTLDHPFIYIIYSPSNIPLFIGVIQTIN